MASAIEPGMWCECVDASPLEANGKRFGPSGLRLGALYLVLAVVPTPLGWRDYGIPEIVVQGVENPYGGGFKPDRFRPIYRPSADLIESLKQPAPEPV